MPRLNVQINDATCEALEEIAAKRGITLTEVMRRATSCLKYLEDALEDNDLYLVERDQHGQVTSRTRLVVV